MNTRETTSEEIDVLREMVRLAESRRTEELQRVSTVNQYNMALIGFAGGFLSLLVTASFPHITVIIAGAFLIISITMSLISLAPRTLKGAIVRIDDDVSDMRNGKNISMSQFLLDTADIMEKAGFIISNRGQEKKLLTVLSTFFLALALFTTYIIYVFYA